MPRRLQSTSYLVYARFAIHIHVLSHLECFATFEFLRWMDDTGLNRLASDMHVY